MQRIRPYEPPDRDAFVHPWNDRQLLAYYDDLRRWHGYIRFLGMPHRKDEPDVRIEDLYVEPFVSKRWMTPDNIDVEDAVPSVEALVGHPRLVLLGDPGSGKSTLVSWVAWQLSRSRLGRLREGLGNLVPVPMVLREMKMEHGTTWGKLWTSFLDRPVAGKLRKHDRLDELLDRGQVIFLLDGLDELSSVEVRKGLRSAVFEGMRRYPRCRFVLTSRLVGYDDVPFHVQRREENAEQTASPEEDAEQTARLGYVAPFSDDQIKRFATNWYVSREKAQVRAEGGAAGLIDAVRRNHHTLSLARIPNLLTFMALIHRVRAQLPDGRALLYDEIAEAYLVTIDTFRGLQEMDFPLHQKTRWLGFVAYQMQIRRKEDEDKGAREILIDQATVEKWLAEEMRRDEVEKPETTAAAFLDYLGRRSGLLLPKGEGFFAFAHLSFQEFFAATYLLRLVIAPRRVQKKIAQAFDEDLERYGDSVAWSETLILLFELLTRHPDFVDDVLDSVFGESLKLVADDGKCGQETRAVVLAQAAIDPQSVLRAADRLQAIRVGWEWERRRQESKDFPSGVAKVILLAEARLRSQVLDIFRENFESAKRLFLDGCPNVEQPDVFAVIVSLQELRRLDLRLTRVEDVSPLSALKNLSHLDLSSTRVEDVSPLSSLKNLSYLDLSSTRVEDVSPLSSLQELRRLDLRSTRVEDVSPLDGIEGLAISA